MEATTYTSQADEIVAGIVTEKQRDSLGKTVEEFGNEVQEEARGRAELLQEHFGDAVDDLAGDIIDRSQSYAEARNELFDPQGKVDNAAEIGAAAFVNKSDNSVTYDVSGMEYQLPDEGYWERVQEHEEIHQKKQAAAFNRDNITYVDGTGGVKSIEVHSTLVEWQPSSQANIPEDLTPDYQQHVDDGEDLANAIGPDGQKLMEDALKTGDMQGLQEKIIEQQREQIVENVLKGELQPEELSV